MKRTLAAALLLAGLTAPATAQTDPLGPSVRLMLFGDASYVWSEHDTTEGFALGQVVAHLNAVLSDRLTMAAEATLTSRSTGTIATIERVILAYHFSDALRLSAGRYHTPISWWNTQYHHGLWLQTSIDRPNMVRFGTPLIPVHFLGLLASGTVPAGRSTLVYDAGFGNGRQPDLVSPGDAGDANAKPAFLAGIRFRPAPLQGFEIGAHAYVDEVDPGLDAGPVDERIFGGHAVWLTNPELVIEYLQFMHDPEGAASTTSHAFYAQAGWRLPGARTVQPYVRFETIDIAEDDALFAGRGLGYDGVIGGVRWDFATFGALKAELRSEKPTGGERGTSIAVNASFVVPNIIE